jgi:peroxiredoxin
MTRTDSTSGFPFVPEPWPGESAEVFDATGIAARAKRVGDLAPDAILPDAFGKPVRLSDLWRKGPLVIVFYRGGWCTYCNLQLRAWRQHQGELARLGATLLAISPQTPDNSQSTAEKNELAFTVLSDSALEAACGFGIAYTLHPDLVDFYGSIGTDIPVLNGNGLWVLPVPATYVVDSTGGIRFALVEEDIRQRAEPRDVITALERLALRT